MSNRPSSGSGAPPADCYSEKRSYLRYALWFPVTLVGRGAEPTEGGGPLQVWAICRDASVGGLQLSSVALIPNGTEVTARFRASPNVPRERVVDATVVRSETNEGELMLPFPFRLALKFAEPVPGLLEELRDELGLEKPG